MEQTTQEELDKLSKEEKEKIFKDEQWHPAEIRRQDVLDLLNNTKKLAEMYGDFLAMLGSAFISEADPSSLCIF